MTKLRTRRELALDLEDRCKKLGGVLRNLVLEGVDMDNIHDNPRAEFWADSMDEVIKDIKKLRN